jgi:hypothetical protein
MQKDQLNKYIAQIVIAIGVEGQPNSYVWMTVDPQMSDLETYNLILDYLIKDELVVNRGHFLTLTEKGMKMYQQIRELLMPRKS